MYRDDEAALHAEALGMVAALLDSAIGEKSKQDLQNAYEVLTHASLTEPPSPADVGLLRRTSDFKALQELLMALSLCPGVERSHVIVTMIFVSGAEAHWVRRPSARLTSVFAPWLKRRKSDRSPAAPATAPAHAEAEGTPRS